MTTFPSLIPGTRTYLPGVYPHTTHRAYSGREVRVRHSNAPVEIRLRLFFPLLTTAEMLEIKAHYAGQRGGFDSFDIPDELLSGMDTPADFTPAKHQWKYVGRVQVEDIPIHDGTPSNRHNVTVELESEPAAPAVFVPRTTMRLSALAPTIVGTPNTVGVPIVTYALTPLVPTISTASTFSPSDLSPVAWWDASDSSTITLASSAVSQWNDKSGNGWTLSQATSTKRPTYSTAAINGLNAALWPSGDNDDFLQTAAGGSFTIREFYAVIKFANAAFSNYEGLLNIAANGPDGWFVGNASGGGVFFSNPIYVNGNNSTDRQSDLRTEFASTCLVRWVRASAQTTTAGVVLGMDRLNDSLNRGWNGHICEVTVFDDLLATDDRSELETYLMDKWGI